jgi:hypothetical protein
MEIQSKEKKIFAGIIPDDIYDDELKEKKGNGYNIRN